MRNFHYILWKTKYTNSEIYEENEITKMKYQAVQFLIRQVLLY